MSHLRITGLSVLCTVSRQPNTPDVWVLEPGIEQVKKRKTDVQPQGTVRYNYATGTLTIKMSVLPMKGGALVNGAPMEKYPEHDPPGGGTWAFDGATRKWKARKERAGRAVMQKLSTRVPEWSVYRVS